MATLQEAWKWIRSKRPAPGIDRIRVEDFEKNLDLNLKTLRQEIKEEKYRPNPVMVYHDRKAKGKSRTLGISTIRDRIVQQAVLISMKPRFETIFLPCSYAYRPKKSAPAAVKQADICIREGKHWALQMDIENFFDTIDHRTLLKFIKQRIDEPPVLRLIARLIRAKIFKEMGLFDNTVGSQQGSGLSPLLSNIYLHPLDTVMWKEFKTAYLRYSDDIIVFTEKREALDDAKALIENSLSELKLSVNRSKTTFAPVSTGIIYLGFYLDLNGKGPSQKSIDQLHEKLEAIPPLRNTDHIHNRLKEVETQIRGWYNYYKSIKAIMPPNILSLISIVRLSREFNEIKYARNLLRQHEVYPHTHPELSLYTADLYTELGMFIQAVRQYARTLQLDPSLTAAKEKIRALQDKESDIHKAIDKTHMAIHHHPEYQEGYEKLAEYYAKLGLYGFAEKAAAKALELNRDSKVNASIENLSEPSEDAPKILSFTTDDVKIFLDAFQGRTDSHGRQWIDSRGKWGFIRVDFSLDFEKARKHLAGEDTLAVYPVTEKDTVRFIVFDIDIANRVILQSTRNDLEKLRQKTHNDILRIKDACRRMGLSLYIEDSGYKGRHGWLFFSEEIPAGPAIRLGEKIMKQTGKPADGIVWELFPRGKIDRDKLLIKLPLGLNKKNSRRCWFLDNHSKPVPDQIYYLKKRRLNDIENLNFPGDSLLITDDQGISFSGDQIIAPDGIKEMVNNCKIIRHLIHKAKDTNYLNHYERICLLYTLTFAGEKGNEFLHQVMACCINYNYHHTQRYIDQRKESPISCAKIKENFFELADDLCHCKLHRPPRGYLSPVLHLLAAEIKGITPNKVFSTENIIDSSDDVDKPDSKNETAEPAAILDFENIFFEENKPVKEIRSDSSNTSFSDLDNPKINERPNTISEQIPKHDQPQSESPDICDLFLKYIKLHRDKMKVMNELDQLTAELERHFDKNNTDAVATKMGVIKRIRDQNGQSRWELKC